MPEEPRVKTGIPGLDKMLGGGFPKGSSVIVAGESGTGKSTFGLQFIYAGATVSREPGMIITFEETKASIIRNSATLGMDLGALDREKKLVVLEYPAQEMGHFMAQEVIIHDAVEQYKVKRVFIDSITTFALMYETEHKRREEVVKILNKLSRWGCTVVLSSEVEEEGKNDLKARFGIETLCDGVVYLYNAREGDVRARKLEVYKMRGTSHETKVVPVKFTNAGLSID
jgi:KaiC/GvpD/RAD55 family RecA-like ATPase